MNRGLLILAALLGAPLSASAQSDSWVSWNSYTYPAQVQSLTPTGFYADTPYGTRVFVSQSQRVTLNGVPVNPTTVLPGAPVVVAVPAGQGEVLTTAEGIATVTSPRGVVQMPVEYFPVRQADPYTQNGAFNQPAAYYPPASPAYTPAYSGGYDQPYVPSYTPAYAPAASPLTISAPLGNSGFVSAGLIGQPTYAPILYANPYVLSPSPGATLAFRLGDVNLAFSSQPAYSVPSFIPYAPAPMFYEPAPYNNNYYTSYTSNHAASPPLWQHYQQQPFFASQPFYPNYHHDEWYREKYASRPHDKGYRAYQYREHHDNGYRAYQYHEQHNDNGYRANQFHDQHYGARPSHQAYRPAQQHYSARPSHQAYRPAQQHYSARPSHQAYRPAQQHYSARPSHQAYRPAQQHYSARPSHQAYRPAQQHYSARPSHEAPSRPSFQAPHGGGGHQPGGGHPSGGGGHHRGRG